MKLDVHFMRDEVLAKEYFVQHIPFREQHANILTKPFTIQHYRWNSTKLTVIQIPRS